MARKNATYIFPEYINKYINIVDEFVQKALHSMKGNKSDETPDMTSLGQLALYATFIMNGKVKGNFIGLILISKLVGTHMSAVKIMSALEIFLKIYH